MPKASAGSFNPRRFGDRAIGCQCPHVAPIWLSNVIGCSELEAELIRDRWDDYFDYFRLLFEISTIRRPSGGLYNWLENSRCSQKIIFINFRNKIPCGRWRFSISQKTRILLAPASLSSFALFPFLTRVFEFLAFLMTRMFWLEAILSFLLVVRNQT